MQEDCLKLSSYFVERSRTTDRVLTKAFIDLYDEHHVAASIVLEGAEGPGFNYQLLPESTLTLSEDLPAVTIAVDTRERVDHLLSRVIETKPHGLVTLERARMLREEISPVQLPEELHEGTKLTIYLGREERVLDLPAFVAICDLFYRRRLSGASVFLGVDGTTHGRRERARLLTPNAKAPMMIIAVGSGQQIAAVLPELDELLRHPLLTLERVQICKRDGHLLQRPHPLPGTDEHGFPLWQKITIYSSESSRHIHERRTPYQELIRRLCTSEPPRGATAVRGVWGFHGDHQPHGYHQAHGSHLLEPRQHVPITTILIDTPEHIATSFDIIDELTTERGLVTSETVPALTTINESESENRLHLNYPRHRPANGQ